jgi:hypothetical protein
MSLSNIAQTVGADVRWHLIMRTRTRTRSVAHYAPRVARTKTLGFDFAGKTAILRFESDYRDRPTKLKHRPLNIQRIVAGQDGQSISVCLD